MRSLLIIIGLSLMSFHFLWSQDNCSKGSLSNYKVFEYSAAHYSIRVYLGESTLLFLDYREMAVGIGIADYSLNPDSTILVMPNLDESKRHISLHNEVFEAKPKLFLIDLNEYPSWRVVEDGIELKGQKTFSCLLKQQ